MLWLKFVVHANRVTKHSSNGEDVLCTQSAVAFSPKYYLLPCCTIYKALFQGSLPSVDKLGWSLGARLLNTV